MSSPAIPGLCATSFALALGLAAPAAATTFTDLHSFCSEAGCADGDYPTAPLVADSSGDLFGTTALGGTGGWGTIFELVPRKAGYKFKLLHSFCEQANCTDGQDPLSGLVIDTAGNLYGTTKFGGAQNGGTVFELVRDRNDKLKILHSFCAQGAACADGSLPMYDGLTYRGAQNRTPYDGKSPLYGTTLYGGENNDGYSGTVYQIAPRRSGKKWKESVVWQFCSQANCADGSEPHNGLVTNTTGNLYGVTFAGGNGNDDGVAFQLSRSGKGWNETVLYDFCSAANCADGTNPESPLLPTASGFVGAASGGGTQDAGTLFSLVPNGANSQVSVLYDFCTQANCADGYGPMGQLARDASGNLFGTTVDGGDPNYSRGVVFELPAQGMFSVLHTFCAGGNCSDGAWPVGGVTRDSSGYLFGTASEGGAGSDGTIFELAP
ncbi:MAG: choice-of-anchor tandem repeat GloVer-containing protein [Rhizomicrobium sp.]